MQNRSRRRANRFGDVVFLRVPNEMGFVNDVYTALRLVHPFAGYISIKHYNLLLIQFYMCFQTRRIKEREKSTQTVVVKYITGVGQNLKLCPALKPISITRIRVKTYHCLGLSGYAPDERNNLTAVQFYYVLFRL